MSQQSKSISAEAGFTIIEVLIAMAIFAIGFMAVGALQSASLMQTGDIGRKTEAWTVLEDQIETLKNLRFYTNDNESDDDGDGTTDEIDEQPDNYELDAGSHSETRLNGRYTVDWEVFDDEPIGEQTNIWSASPSNITVSKTIFVSVTETGENQSLATAEFVKTWAADGIQ